MTPPISSTGRKTRRGQAPDETRAKKMCRALRLLTLRERDILQRLASGNSNKEIASALGVSANTIAVHVRNLYRKTGIHSRREAATAVALAARETPLLPGSLKPAEFPRRARGAGQQFVLALDQGTARSCAIVFDKRGRPVSFAQKRMEQASPRPGWVESDGLAIWSAQAGVAAEAIASAGLGGSQIAAVGIANQRATTLVWDRETGRPVCPAIMWQDRRTAEFCDRLARDGHAGWIRAKTGLVPDPYFSASKLVWILDHVKGARRMAETGRLLFGTVGTWLVWNCTQGEVHVTDASNASHTMLYNIHTGGWDRELLSFFRIPECMLPRIRASSEVYGAARSPVFAAGAPLAALVGDQQAAMFGQRCNRPGMVKCTYGAGCFMVMNTGTKLTLSENNLLTTVAWRLGREVTYALEGNIYVAGAVVDWLRDGLGLIRKAGEAETLAASVPDSGGVYLVPAFDGLGAPHWKPQARGTLVGMTRGTEAGHLARAALEGIAYQTRDALKAMEADAGIPIPEVRVDGEGTANRLLMQFQSDILGVPVSCPKAPETRALGAAYLAGLAVGYWSGQAEIDRQWQEGRRFSPAMEAGRARQLAEGWERALKAAAYWAGE
jgi:glycerol kinase